MTKFEDRALQILTRKVFAKKLKSHRSDGTEYNVEEIKSQFAESFMEVSARWTVAQLAGQVQGCLSWNVKLAAQLLDERNLERFVEKVGTAINRRAAKTLCDRVSDTILRFWDCFDTEQLASDPRLRELRTLPGLSRWSGPAAREFLNWWHPRELHVTYRTYLRRVERMRLKSEKPILVTKFKSDASRKPSITFSSSGREWIATQTFQKMSHDNVTPTLFNAANESGKGAPQRSRRKKRRVTRGAAA